MADFHRAPTGRWMGAVAPSTPSPVIVGLKLVRGLGTGCWENREQERKGRQQPGSLLPLGGGWLPGNLRTRLRSVSPSPLRKIQSDASPEIPFPLLSAKPCLIPQNSPTSSPKITRH